MTKSTPGPWQVHQSHIYTADPERALLAQVHNPGSRASDYPLVANARLIASAPDLLRALEEIMEHIDMDGPTTADEPDEDSVGWNDDGTELPMTFGHLRRARATISRAKGEDQ